MLIHTSTDRIFFLYNGQKDILPYGDLEKNLPSYLYDRFKEATAVGSSHEGQSDEGEKKIAHIILVNGPGSFTNLRIATLALNTYNTLRNFGLQFHDVNKVQRYVALYQHGKVKRYCVMYIGQKKKFWFVDLQAIKNGNDVNSYDDAIKTVHIDDLKEVVENVGEDWFMDELLAEAKDTMDAIFQDYEMYSFGEEDYELMGDDIQRVALLEPHYMIDANVS